MSMEGFKITEKSKVNPFYMIGHVVGRILNHEKLKVNPFYMIGHVVGRI
jgi:hypothetical protein